MNIKQSMTDSEAKVALDTLYTVFHAWYNTDDLTQDVQNVLMECCMKMANVLYEDFKLTLKELGIELAGEQSEPK